MAVKRVLICALALGVSANAPANYMGMFSGANTASVNIAGTIAVNAAIKKQAENAAGNKTASRSGSAAAGQLADNALALSQLTYSPSPAVSKRVKQEFKVAVQRANPEKAAHIENVLANQDVISDFNRDMSPYSLRSTNIADTMTAYWITLWMIANKADVPAPQRVAAVKGQMMDTLATNQMVRQASEVQRQEIAEGMVYETMLALGMRANANRTGNKREIQTIADDAQKNMLKLGVDLRRLKLTAAGFSSS